MKIISSSIKAVSKPYLHAGYISGSQDNLTTNSITTINLISIAVGVLIAFGGAGVAVILRKFLKKVNKKLYVAVSVILILLSSIGGGLLFNFVMGDVALKERKSFKSVDDSIEAPQPGEYEEKLDSFEEPEKDMINGPMGEPVEEVFDNIEQDE